MDKKIKFIFSIDDQELLEACKNEFGENLILQRENSLSGFEIFFVAIIPTVGVSIALIDFIVKYFSKNTFDKAENQLPSKRKVEIDGSRITLSNYDAEDVSLIITSFMENQCNE